MNDIQFRKSYESLVNPGVTALPGGASPAPSGRTNAADGEFRRLLEQSLEAQNTAGQTAPVNFSKHALNRIDSRQVEVTGVLLTKLGSAVDRAGAKGVKDALILDGQTAFIVNVPSRTVITAVSGQDMTDNLFTNIDGAVIL